MSTEVEFLLLKNSSQWLSVTYDSMKKVSENFDRILVMSDDRKKLIQLDELLWHKSSEQFIPFSLDTECYGNTAGALLTTEQPSRIRYQAMINSSGLFPTNPQQFRTIVEVVDIDEASKEKSRECYKRYRQQGFIITHREIE